MQPHRFMGEYICKSESLSPTPTYYFSELWGCAIFEYPNFQQRHRPLISQVPFHQRANQLVPNVVGWDFAGNSLWCKGKFFGFYFWRAFAKLQEETSFLLEDYGILILGEVPSQCQWISDRRRFAYIFSSLCKLPAGTIFQNKI